MHRVSRILTTSGVILAAACSVACAQSSSSSDFPPHATILKDYTKVVSQANITPMYTLYTRKKDGQMYMELPRTFASKKYYMAMTLASGDTYAGLQGNDMYVYWRRYDKRLALMQPQLETRAEGDKEASASVKRLFTDQLLVDVPIVTIGPGGGPVVDADALFINSATRFFGASQGRVGTSARYGIFSISTAKAFKNNVEIAFEVPNSSGALKKLHYSISEIPSSTGYKPRVADQRVGYFTTAFSDLAKYNDRETRVRYINRWHLEKADSKLELSPPKRPIVFYIEHTTPVRYRRWVKDGILAWNKAFEKIGISDAIEVYYQDATSGAHMDKDPEDVTYNFVRWLNNDIGTAIGPSRVNPLTGQILDADIILTDGWIRHYQKQFNELLPKVAMEGFSPETLAWLAEHPSWDPRIRLAPPEDRRRIAKQIARESLRPMAGHPLGNADPALLGDDEYDGLIGRVSQVNGMCLASENMSFDLALMKMTLGLLQDEADSTDEKKKEEEPKEKDKDASKDEAKDDGDKKEEKKDDEKKEADEKKDEAKDEEKKKKPKGPMLDGMPESFVGPLVAHLVAHEVGHTLGLRHNFKASSRYTMAEINSDKVKGKEQLATSVMDYIAANINMGSGDVQGDWCMTGIGPYDMWAIEYGYTFGDTDKVLARNTEPENDFGTDEDTSGPDPFARRYDFSKDPLDYAENQMRLAKHHRGRLLDNFLEDGDSWDRVRYGYELTLSLQTRVISMMGNWVGGAFVHRNKKGDPNATKPIKVVPADQQRKAIRFVLDNSFSDEAFGLNPELTTSMGLDQWLDARSSSNEATWPIHDRIMGIQSSALTMLMNPTTLKRVYDNEFRVPADEDALTLPELLGDISTAAWKELDEKSKDKFTNRKPMISSLRRNLQREHLERLIDLTLPGSGSLAASKTISMLAADNLRKLLKKIEATQGAGADRHDAYTAAHLAQAKTRIEKALDADYILNPSRGGGMSSGLLLLFGNEETQPQN